MPFSIPAPDVVLTDANFTTPLKSFVDGLETSTAAAQTTATAAGTLAAQKYTKPSGGIPASDLAGTIPVLSTLVTGGATRVSGGALHLFNDPAVTPVNPQPGDLWVGDIA